MTPQPKLQKEKSMAETTKKPEKVTVPYSDRADLLAVLRELDGNVTASLNQVEASPADGLVLTAQFIDDLHSIVDDVTEYLIPHVESIEIHWENREPQPKAQPKLQKGKKR